MRIVLGGYLLLARITLTCQGVLAHKSRVHCWHESRVQAKVAFETMCTGDGKDYTTDECKTLKVIQTPGPIPVSAPCRPHVNLSSLGDRHTSSHTISVEGL